MINVGEKLQYKLSGNLEDGGVVLHTSQVAHVTFYITKLQHKEQWKLFSESEKLGICECVGEAHYDYSAGAPTRNEYFNEYDSYEEATQGLANEIIRLEQILEEKRKGRPTPKQLHFLFRHGIPIPLELTWGQASDIIDECIAQGRKTKRKNQSEKYDGFMVGMIVYQYTHCSQRGKWHINKGEVTKLTSTNDSSVKYAYVRWDKSEYYPGDRVSIKTLWKREASEEELHKIESQKFYPGDKVLHSTFGIGIVLHAGKEVAGVQFEDGRKYPKLEELTLVESEVSA